MGRNTTASGDYSTAMGAFTAASGSYSTALGWNTTASGDFSTAMGAATTASGDFSTAMGNSTTASGDSATAMGRFTTASGDYSMAMGRLARARHDGSFVWADTQNTDFESAQVNQFSIRASGGVRLSDDTPALSFGSNARQMINLFGTSYGIGVQSGTTYFRTATRFSWYAGGVHNDTQNSPGTGGETLMTLTSGGLVVAGTVVSASDRNTKENITAVDPREVLEKVSALPIARWNYKHDQGTPHLGPMAQDFHAAFGVGPDDKHISMVDADGVALAAIQGLNQKVEQLGGELKRRDAENTELKARLTNLEKLITNLSPKGN
jgi:hypothetical protein